MSSRSWNRAGQPLKRLGFSLDAGHPVEAGANEHPTGAAHAKSERGLSLSVARRVAGAADGESFFSRATEVRAVLVEVVVESFLG